MHQGGGKIPINPEYVLKHDEDGILLKNYEGETFHYPSSKNILHKKPFLIP
jgi:lysine 2,3-aminomutase